MIDESPANGSTEPQAPQSFRERKMQQLAAERTEREASDPTRQPEPEEAPDDVETLADDTADREPETELLDDSEEQPEGDYDDDADQDEVAYSPREIELQEAAEKAEGLRKSMEKDYRHKTHKLSQDRKAASDERSEVKRAADYYANMAAQELAQFDGVNWAELRTRPEEYQQAQQRYLQVEAAARQRQAEREQINARSDEMDAADAQREAEHSKAVLQQTRPDWNQELYGKAREWASEELDYSPDEFDKITDWRLMLALVKGMEADGIKTKSKKLIRKAGKQRAAPAAGRNANQTSNRDAKGKFTNARKEAFDKPGDRQSFREMKFRQLQMERNKR